MLTATFMVGRAFTTPARYQRNVNITIRVVTTGSAVSPLA